MKLVRVNRDELLEIVRKNREEHFSIVEEAQANYRKAVIAELEKLLVDAKAGRIINTEVDLIVPLNKTTEYDQVIQMIEMSIDDEIELTFNEFQNYVRDIWNWTGQFAQSNTPYSDKFGK